MNIFDFITQDELDDLPEDSSAAFISFVRHAQRRLDVKMKELDGSDQNDWHIAEQARYGFTNVVVAAARRFEIEPFASQHLPRAEKFSGDDYQQFKADLDHYLTQMLLDNAIRGKRDSVSISPIEKDRIRSYLHGLKTAIDSSNFSESKRTSLLEKLAEFERELDKRRMSLFAVTRLTFEILAVPGGLWASYEVAAKLITNINQVVGEAKAVDNENRLLALPEAPRALLPPRPIDVPATKSELFKRDEMDDEIPF
ncbi:MAG TPA: hypothetical protein VN685_03200 [Rhizomicrobium sp.]|nr:hypothetical protein [Rhizomicrobium sp.]